MTRVVLHPGFHKTGTSTVEHMLLRNAQALDPYAQILGNPQLGDAPELAKRHSVQRTDKSRMGFAAAWAAALMPVDANRAAIISCVDLFGRIPGHPAIKDYSATPDLLRIMVQGLEARFGAALDLQIYVSVRDAKKWLKSLWFQNLKVHRICADFADFAEQFREVARLDISALSAAAGPWPITACPLDTARLHALGPAGPLLDFVTIPKDVRASLAQQKPLKVSFPDDAKQVLLELNRSDLDDTALREAKDEAISLLKGLGI